LNKWWNGTEWERDANADKKDCEDSESTIISPKPQQTDCVSK